MDQKKYEVGIAESPDGLLFPDGSADDFHYCVLENLTLSEVMELLEMFAKQTYHPLIAVREMDDGE